mmetsp:Transcript_10991/g.27858  ORF Transcript_10991/g.27858 Transcript_10991/m.27858 type:complete len:457 (-) Transcript_10991:39-1409(-)
MDLVSRFDNLEDMRDAYGFDVSQIGLDARACRRRCESVDANYRGRWEAAIASIARAGDASPSIVTHGERRPSGDRARTMRRISRMVMGTRNGGEDNQAPKTVNGAPAPEVSTAAPTVAPPPRVDKNGRASGSFKAMIRRGVPAEHRPVIWPLLARLQGAVAHDEEYLRSASYSLPRDDANARQIEMDLARTFPGNTALRIVHSDISHGDDDDDDDDAVSDGNGDMVPSVPTPARGSTAHKNALRLMLRAYSATHPATGYCQGMNYVAAFLLLVIGPERVADAYAVFAFLLDRVLYPRTYDANLSGAHVSLMTLGALLEKKFPRLHAHMSRHDCSDPSLFATDWFLTLMCKSLPAETAARVWDTVLSEGSKVLYRASLALLKLAEDRMLRGDHAGSVLEALNHETRDCHDRERLLTTMFHGIGSLPMRVVMRAQVKSVSVVNNQLADRFNRRSTSRK